MSIGLGLSGPEFASLTADQRRSEDDAVSDLGSVSTADRHLQRWSASRRGGAATPSLTRLNGLALVISLQIGSGIFSAPSQISQHVTAPGNGLLVWVVGGVLVWTGAASFIELGLRIPSNGGIQEYLRTCYGDFMGFMFAWSWIAIAKPAANAVGATIFADYVLKAIWPFEPLGKWTVKWVAIIDIAVLTFVNCLGATTGAKAANIFSLLKISALGSIVLIGFIVYIFGYGDGIPVAEMGWFGLERSQIPLTTWQWLGNFCTALFGALFCYGGWETVGFVLGDMANPEADLPVIINVAMTTVIIGFFAMNMALYICLPMEVIRGSTTVAVEFARRTVGGWAGLVFSVVVALSAMGALNANLFATAKLCVAAAHRRYFPAVLANLHCSSAHDEAEYLEQTIPWLFRLPIALLARLTRKLRWQQSVPILALLLNGALASLYVLVGSFNALVTFIGIAEYFFFLMSVLGIFVLRKKESRRRLKGSMARYNTWTLNPIIFAAISGLLILRGIIAEPIQGLAAIVVGLFGLMIFCLKFGLRGFSHFGPV